MIRSNILFTSVCNRDPAGMWITICGGTGTWWPCCERYSERSWKSWRISLTKAKATSTQRVTEVCWEVAASRHNATLLMLYSPIGRHFFSNHWDSFSWSYELSTVVSWQVCVWLFILYVSSKQCTISSHKALNWDFVPVCLEAFNVRAPFFHFSMIPWTAQCWWTILWQKASVSQSLIYLHIHHTWPTVSPETIQIKREPLKEQRIRRHPNTMNRFF